MTKAQVPQVDEVAEAKAARDAAIKHYNEVLSTHRAAALTTVKATITEYGFTAKELGLTTATKTPATKKTAWVTGQVYVNPANRIETWVGGRGQCPEWFKQQLAAAANKSITGQVYVNPANKDETWTGGKGQRPKWLKEQLAAGKLLSELAGVPDFTNPY